MDFTFSCPGCGQHISANATQCGTQATCPTCSAPFEVPYLDRFEENEDRSGKEATRPCPMCGEQILAVAKKCRHCGEYLDGSIAPSKPHGIHSYDQVPWYRRSGVNSAFVLLGLVTGVSLIITTIVLLTGDIYYNKLDKDGMLKKWSVANKVVAVILLLSWIGFISIVGFSPFRASVPSIPVPGLSRLSTSELQDQVRDNISATWAKDPTMQNARVISFSLIQKEANEYDGLLSAEVNGTPVQMAVDVTYDGQTFMWKMRQ